MPNNDFATRLEGLIKMATKGPWVVNKGNVTTRPRYAKWGPSGNNEGYIHKLVAVQPADAELIAFLANHAPAIARLVKAADRVVYGMTVPLRRENIPAIMDELASNTKSLEAALAALNAEGKP